MLHFLCKVQQYLQIEYLQMMRGSWNVWIVCAEKIMSPENNVPFESTVYRLRAFIVGGRFGLRLLAKIRFACEHLSTFTCGRLFY